MYTRRRLASLTATPDALNKSRSMMHHAWQGEFKICRCGGGRGAERVREVGVRAGEQKGPMRVGRVYFLLTLLSRLGENVQGGFDVALIKRDGGIN